jgi:uncharacterized iron-regulated membrane protein
VLFNVHDGSDRLSHLDAVAFDRSGAAYHVSRSADNNLGQAIIGSLGSLHFGWFGGGWIRIAYGLLGLAMTYLAAGGVLIWLARRRAKNRPAPGWERVWSAVIWGQPLALAAAMAVTVIAGAASPVEVSGALPLFAWGAAGLLMLALAVKVPARAIARMGRMGLGALVIAAVLTQIGSGGWSARDPMAWAVDAVLVAVAAVVLRGARRPRMR